jgi:hypothetical protein
LLAVVAGKVVPLVHTTQVVVAVLVDSERLLVLQLQQVLQLPLQLEQVAELLLRVLILYLAQLPLLAEDTVKPGQVMEVVVALVAVALLLAVLVTLLQPHHHKVIMVVVVLAHHQQVVVAAQVQ